MSQQLRDEARRLKNDILKRDKNQCYVCGFGCVIVLVTHYIVPIAKGGTSNEENLVTLCPNCHAIVHKLSPHAHQIELDELNIETDPVLWPDELWQIWSWANHSALPDDRWKRLYAIALMQQMEGTDYGWAN